MEAYIPSSFRIAEWTRTTYYQQTDRAGEQYQMVLRECMMGFLLQILTAVRC